jgi:excisionase family DNA binding protein
MTSSLLVSTTTSSGSATTPSVPLPHFFVPTDMKLNFEMTTGDGEGMPIILWMHEPTACRGCNVVRTVFVNRFGATTCAVCDAEKNLTAPSVITERMYTQKEVAQILHIPVGTVRHLRRAKKLSYRALGHRIIRIPESSLLALLEASKVNNEAAN